MSEGQRVVRRVIRSGKVESGKFNFDEASVRLKTPSDYINQYRQEALELYRGKAMPQTSEEAWRRTDLKYLADRAGELSAMGEPLAIADIPASYFDKLADSNAENSIILASSSIQRHVNAENEAAGLVFTDLQTAEQVYPHLLEKVMGRLVATSADKLAAMAAAFNQNGIFLYVPKGMKLDAPVNSLVWGAFSKSAIFTHVLAYIDEGAELTFVHEYASANAGLEMALHSGLVEIIVEKDAKFKFVELQSWGDNVWNITHEKMKVNAGAEAEWIFGSAGSRVTKNFSDIEVAETGASGKVSGFYFASGNQHLDHDTQQLHLAPNTTSDLLFKGALVGNSRSVWQGMIYVAPEAQKTDGYQTNRNLILSPDARADSIPGLEILADDVKCSHGATVGRIDQDQVFYLLSRGIPRNEAERLIVEGYFDPIMERIPFDGVKARFQRIIHEKMQLIQ